MVAVFLVVDLSATLFSTTSCLSLGSITTSPSASVTGAFMRCCLFAWDFRLASAFACWALNSSSFAVQARRCVLLIFFNEA